MLGMASIYQVNELKESQVSGNMVNHSTPVLDQNTAMFKYSLINE